MYDGGRMDGAGDIHCSGTCLTTPQFKFVNNSTGILDPYLELATQYGWANYMFQTNQGPSFPAHQFVFGGTSAPNAADDAAGIFAAENMSGTRGPAGCIALAGTFVRLVTPSGENQTIYPCFEHQTMADLFDSSGVSWKYYAPARAPFGQRRMQSSTFANQMQGDYQYGFRVPLIVVSAFRPSHYINNEEPHDFGSILRFIQGVFDLGEGSLGFADARATGDLGGFFKFDREPRLFHTIIASLDANFFLNDTRTPDPPDND
jgi:phospholipase C